MKVSPFRGQIPRTHSEKRERVRKRLENEGEVNTDFLPLTKEGRVLGMGPRKNSNLVNLETLSRHGRLLRSNRAAIDRLKRMNKDTSKMSTQKAAKYIVNQVHDNRPFYKYRQLQYLHKRGRSKVNFSNVIDNVDEITLYIRPDSDIAGRPSVLHAILQNMVKKYPSDVVTLTGPSRNVLHKMKQTGMDVINNSGLHRTGTNVRRVNMSQNMSRFRSDSKVVPTRGRHQTTNTLNVPPNHLVFENGKRSWKFTAKKTNPHKVALGENHTVVYTGSDGKVKFQVR